MRVPSAERADELQDLAVLVATETDPIGRDLLDAELHRLSSDELAYVVGEMYRVGGAYDRHRQELGEA